MSGEQANLLLNGGSSNRELKRGTVCRISRPSGDSWDEAVLVGDSPYWWLGCCGNVLCDQYDILGDGTLVQVVNLQSSHLGPDAVYRVQVIDNEDSDDWARDDSAGFSFLSYFNVWGEKGPRSTIGLVGSVQARYLVDIKEEARLKAQESKGSNSTNAGTSSNTGASTDNTTPKSSTDDSTANNNLPSGESGTGVLTALMEAEGLTATPSTSNANPGGEVRTAPAEWDCPAGEVSSRHIKELFELFSAHPQEYDFLAFFQWLQGHPLRSVSARSSSSSSSESKTRTSTLLPEGKESTNDKQKQEQEDPNTVELKSDPISPTEWKSILGRAVKKVNVKRLLSGDVVRDLLHPYLEEQRESGRLSGEAYNFIHLFTDPLLEIRSGPDFLVLRLKFSNGAGEKTITLPTSTGYALDSGYTIDPLLVHRANRVVEVKTPQYDMSFKKTVAFKISEQGILGLRPGDVCFHKSVLKLPANIRYTNLRGRRETDSSGRLYVKPKDDEQRKHIPSSSPLEAHMALDSDGTHYLPKVFQHWVVLTVFGIDNWVGIPDMEPSKL